MITYGTLAHADGKWLVDCQPHVRIMLKRLFPRINAGSCGQIAITDTLEVSRNLRWFLSRFPLECSDPGVAKLLNERAAEHKHDENITADLLSGVRAPREFELALPPRVYQRVAADLILTHGGLLVADDLGLGKTITGICVLTDPRALPALIVAPTHLVHQWKRQLKRFAPHLHVHMLQKRSVYDLRATNSTKPGQMMLTKETPDVLIATYAKIGHGWADTLAPVIKTVIYDEAQELRRQGKDKNDLSIKYAAAKHLSEHVRFSVGLTATPIYNYGDEIYNVLNVIRPGALGEQEEFNREWCDAGNSRGQRSIKDPAAFGNYARQACLMIRRTREDCGFELPKLTKVMHEVECDEEALKAIEGPAAELAKRILAKDETHRGEKMQASEELSNMVRQATGIAKAVYVANLVRMLVEEGEPVILFGWHRAVYSLWMEQLKDLNPELYTGSESATQKDRAAQRFINGDTKLLILSLRSGAGLDGLQHVCRFCVFGELDWTPGVHAQCCGRIDRPEQTRPVFAYFTVANSGSDPFVTDVLRLKKAQADGIQDPKGEAVEFLDVAGEHVKKLAESYLKKRSAA